MTRHAESRNSALELLSVAIRLTLGNQLAARVRADVAPPGLSSTSYLPVLAQATAPALAVASRIAQRRRRRWTDQRSELLQSRDELRAE